MRLLNLFEADQQVWYHGSPEGQKLGNGFESRSMTVSYLTDPATWISLQDQMGQLEGGSDEYMALIKQANELTAQKKVPSPIFFSDQHHVANTYADDARAWDYQNADPKVFKAEIDAGKNLSVYAGGQSFRGITIDAVKRSVIQSGVDEATAETIIAQFSQNFYGRSNGAKISTDQLATIAYDLGYDTIDVKSVKDTYMGGGPNATVRMVFDPARITLQG